MVGFNIFILSQIFIFIFFFISDDLIARDIEEFERQKHHLKSNLKVHFTLVGVLINTKRTTSSIPLVYIQLEIGI